MARCCWTLSRNLIFGNWPVNGVVDLLGKPLLLLRCSDVITIPPACSVAAVQKQSGDNEMPSKEHKTSTVNERLSVLASCVLG